MVVAICFKLPKKMAKQPKNDAAICFRFAEKNGEAA